jgi:hypothetical protein
MLQTAACRFGYLAQTDLLSRAYAAETAASEKQHYESPLKVKAPHFPARAKRVICLFMQGAPSHVDTFDYKPTLVSADGRNVGGRKILAPQWKFKPYGKSGLYISDLFPNVAKHADDLCLINSMHCDQPAHPQATIQLHTGSVRFVRPSMGSWIVYGLGTPNQNLPGFITINPPAAVGGAQNYGAGFLPAAFEGTPITGGARALPNITAAAPPSLQRKQIDLVQTMNREMLRRSGDNPQIEGIIESYELGFRMQSTVPQVMDISKESKKTQELYGIGQDATDTFGRQCLMARRFAEAGVRFI